MDPACSGSPGAPSAVKELTAEEVLRWLAANKFRRAHAALQLDLEPQPPSHSADSGEDSGSTSPPLPLQQELANSVEEALTAYKQLAGESSIYTLLEHWDPHLLPTYHERRCMGGSGLERSELEKRIDDLGESCARLRTRERELDTQLKLTVTIIAERLQALVASVDPMRKDILLPLLRTVAVFGSSSSIRAAARHMTLTLYKRPTIEHRLAIVQEWLRIARDAPPRSLEQELIPELYSLVNAPVFERRLLALDCAAAVAPLLRQSPQVRYSLCQGLLRPLCEDEASAVRRELPRCLSLLWGDAAPSGAGSTNANASGGDDAAAQSTAVSAAAAAAASTAQTHTVGATAAVSLAPAQQAFVMETLVHLATDAGSRTVRQAAQTQLCEVLYPVFLSDGVLLTQFVPLLLTVIGMEATQMLLQRKPTTRSSAASAAAAESRKSDVDETAAAVASALSLSNVLTLVQLVQAALRCVAAEVVHAREEEGRHGERGQQGATPTAATALANTYVHVVLPTAHNLLTPLLSKLHYGSPLRGEDGDSSSSGGVGGGVSGRQDPATQLCGPLCALCAALASLVPLLGAAAWDKVADFLKSSLTDYLPPGSTVSLRGGVADTATASSSSSFALAAPHDSSQGPQELLRGRRLFVYAYFVLLSGDAGAFADRAEPRIEEDGGAVGSSLPTAHQALPSRCLQQEGLRFLAHQIRLESDNLTSPRTTAMTTCVHCIASLAPFALESHEVSTGLTALTRFLVASPDPRLRLTAVVLVHDACAAIANERLKVTLLIEPLLPLLEDLQPLVQEAALTGILSSAIALTEPRAQEKAIRPVLRVADVAGCTSRFTCCVLMQWDQLMQRMPAEPREALLYPQLSALMDRLAEQYVERVSQVGMVPPPPPSLPLPANTVGAGSSLSAAPSTSFAGHVDCAAAAPRAVSCEPQDRSVEQWESTMLILQALLHNILRCAVVTPTLVARYLLPGIQQLASEGVLSACSANVRTRWQRLLKNYLLFAETNASRYSSSGVHSSAGNLLDRVKDELKRRL